MNKKCNKFIYGLEGSGKTYGELCDIALRNTEGTVIFATYNYKLLFEQYEFFRSKFPNVKCQLFAKPPLEHYNKNEWIEEKGLTVEQGREIDNEIKDDTKIVFMVTNYLLNMTHKKVVKNITEIIIDEISWSDIFIKLQSDYVELLKHVSLKYSNNDIEVISNMGIDELTDKVIITALFRDSIPLTVCSSESLFYHFFSSIDDKNKDDEPLYFGNSWTATKLIKEEEHAFNAMYSLNFHILSPLNSYVLTLMSKEKMMPSIQAFLGCDDIFTNKNKEYRNHTQLKGKNTIDISKKYCALFTEYSPNFYLNVNLFFNHVVTKEKTLSIEQIKRLTLRDMICQTAGRVLGYRAYRKNVFNNQIDIVISDYMIKQICDYMDLFPYNMNFNPLDGNKIFDNWKEIIDANNAHKQECDTVRTKIREEKTKEEKKALHTNIRNIMLGSLEITGNVKDRITKEEWEKKFGFKLSKVKNFLTQDGHDWRVEVHSNNLYIKGCKLGGVK
ncbi:MAG: hypothetical protein VKL60_00375 [Sphaerospermopsis sp.]|nr:hypothetical protein [Sphaerospermopsis sp.]